MDFVGSLLALFGGVAVIAGLISILVPLRFIGITSRFTAILIVVAGCMVSAVGSNISPKLKADQQRASYEREKAAKVAQQNSPSAPAFSSSGGCKTDINGDMTCSHSADVNLFGSKSTSTSSMKCRTNPVTQAYECKSDMSAN
jgi:hypothetical protein